MTKSAKNKPAPRQGLSEEKQATSTELTGGAGFTYEDKVVAYYLAALLRSEKAMLQRGSVGSVAVQQEIAWAAIQVRRGQGTTASEAAA